MDMLTFNSCFEMFYISEKHFLYENITSTTISADHFKVLSDIPQLQNKHGSRQHAGNYNAHGSNVINTETCDVTNTSLVSSLVYFYILVGGKESLSDTLGHVLCLL